MNPIGFALRHPVTVTVGIAAVVLGGPNARKRMQATWEKYRARPNAFLLFHGGFCQGITNKIGTAPHPEMGGHGTGPDDRGIRFYYEWVKDTIGPYEYLRHAKGRK